MTHDPMQTYSTLGAYPGVTMPFGLPPTVNPLAAAIGLSPVLQGGGQSPYGQPYGIHPQALQLAMLQNPLLQNPLAAIGQQNPLFYAGVQNPVLQNPLLNPFQAQQLQAQLVAQYLAAQPYAQQPYGSQQPFGGHWQQGISPFAQVGVPYGPIGAQFGQGGAPWGQIGSPLAPQTWVGQGGQFGGGLGYGQVNPLAYLGVRGLHPSGLSPWGV